MTLPSRTLESRVITERVDLPRLRDGAQNLATTVTRLGPHRAAALKSAPSTFSRYGSELRSLLREYTRPGYAAVVVGDRGIFSSAWNQAGPKPRIATIGRHSSCDLMVPGESELSLRHLLLLVREGPSGVARARVFDLAATNGPADSPQMVHSVEVTEHSAIRVPGYWVFFFRTGPEVAELTSEVASVDSATPVVPATRGPSGSIRSETDEVVLSASELATGVLLGRYERCLKVESFGSASVSRVHALLVNDDADTLIVDAGSTNGVLVNGELVRARVLVDHDDVQLGSARLQWRSASTQGGAPRLLPDGLGSMLVAAAAPEGQGVLADWLLERGSKWGEWILASFCQHERAGELEEALAFQLLGPLATLKGHRWKVGILREAALDASQPLTSERAHLSPLWAGLWKLGTTEATMPMWRRLLDERVLRSLRHFEAWSSDDVARAASRARDVMFLRLHTDDAISALRQHPLSKFSALKRLDLIGQVPDSIGQMLSDGAQAPGLVRLTVRGEVDVEWLALWMNGRRAALRSCEVHTTEASFSLRGGPRGLRARVLPTFTEMRAQLRHLPNVRFTRR